MKTSSKLLPLALALGLMSTVARAQELIHVILNLTFSVQADPVDDGTVTKTPAPVKFHVGNKQILTQLETDHGTSYPAKASIAFTNGGFVVVDPSGTILDSIPELTIDTGSENGKVSGGSSNDANNAGTRKSLSIAILSFDDSGDSAQTTPVVFTADGVFTSTKTVTKPASDNSQTETDTATASFAGKGTVGGKNAIVSGTLTAHGKGPFVP